MRKQNKGKFHFWSYIGTLGFGRHYRNDPSFSVAFLLYTFHFLLYNYPPIRGDFDGAYYRKC
jgi:hypothetical protein